MNSQIQKLYHISQKNVRRIIGLMSGTSLDGLDIALCSVGNSGKETTLVLEKFTTIPYGDQFRQRVRQVFARQTVNQQQLSGLNAYIGQIHAKLINQALQDWQVPAHSIDIIASHGQTVFHAPNRLTGTKEYPNSTLQLGDADHIAVNTGIITLADFRQKHIASGGEGAPLAAYGDYLLFSDDTENRFLLNIGGISNFTFLPSRQTDSLAFATDLGPGNTIMNQYMHLHLDKEMDENAAIARQGEINMALLDTLCQDPFFDEAFPKTTGPEKFNISYLDQAQEESATKMLSHFDTMATLNRFSACIIVKGIRELAEDLNNRAIYVSGGGLHNPLLMENIREMLPGYKIDSMDSLGLNPDAKEACLFALLANETLSGSPDNVMNIKDSPAVCMGKISLPY